MRQLQNDTILEELYHLAEINGKYQQRRYLKGSSISMRALCIRCSHKLTILSPGLLYNDKIWTFLILFKFLNDVNISYNKRHSCNILMVSKNQKIQCQVSHRISVVGCQCSLLHSIGPRRKKASIIQ